MSRQQRIRLDRVAIVDRSNHDLQRFRLVGEFVAADHRTSHIEKRQPPEPTARAVRQALGVPADYSTSMYLLAIIDGRWLNLRRVNEQQEDALAGDFDAWWPTRLTWISTALRAAARALAW